MGKSSQYYWGRVEYLASRPDIDALLEKGYSRRMTYDDLHKKGRITMSYQQFCKYLSGGAGGVEPRLPSRRRRKKRGSPAKQSVAAAMEAPALLAPVAGSKTGKDPMTVAENFRPREVRPGELGKEN